MNSLHIVGKTFFLNKKKSMLASLTNKQKCSNKGNSRFFLIIKKIKNN